MRRVFAAVISCVALWAGTPALALGQSPPPRPSASAPQGTGTVRGTVVTGDDAEPQPLAGATVRVTVMPAGPPIGMFQPFSATTTADGTGRFEFTGVPAGVLSFMAEKTGYYNTGDGSDAGVQIELAMRRRRSSQERR